MTDQPKRVTLVADELLGYVRTGGIGTATTFLAISLARMGHDVEVLYGGEAPNAEADGEWSGLYDRSGIRIRMVERGTGVEPSYLGRSREIELALGDDPPDVVVAQDLAGPVYTALRKRQLGLGFDETLFVVYCHGTRRWISDMAQKVRVLPGAHGITILEQASVELADVAVSPSQYVVEWMLGEGWRLPQAVVIPYLSRSVATGEKTLRVQLGDEVPRRIAFFGRVEERKGLRPFAAAVNALEPQLLQNVELVFVGAATPAWPHDRVLELFTDDAKNALRAISFESGLDQAQALAYLSTPGTLAVMPSLGETFSNAVYECLERGIPFIASDAGAPRELVAPEDRAAVLFTPTADGIADALRHTLVQPLRPARLAFDPETAYARWAEVVQQQPRARAQPTSRVDTRAADWVVFLERDDQPAANLVELLTTAQAASGADVVTCGIRLPSGREHLFIGDAGALGVVSNAYGTVGLIRRSLIEDTNEDAWLLYARSALAGATIVSIPDVLVETSRGPRDIEHDPSIALAVAREFERSLPHSTRSLARLAAGLAAESTQPTTRSRRRLSLLLRR